MNTKHKLALSILAGVSLVGMSIVAPVSTLVFADNDGKITICHADGRDGTLHYSTLTLSYNAVYQDHGNGGHFYEDGTPKAGHENDYLGACREESGDPTPTPTTDPVTPTPTTDPVTPTPTMTVVPTATPTNLPSQNTDSGSTSGDTSNSNSDANSGSVEGASTTQGQVLGASTMGKTGSAAENLSLLLMGMGILVSGTGAVTYAHTSRENA